MREATFLKQNEKKWKAFEKVLASTKQSVPPDEIADVFVELTDDLAYARTHFPESKVVNYLNGLAAQVHLKIVHNKKQKTGSFQSFWSKDLPLILGRHRFKLYWAFAIFFVAVIIGVASTYHDQSFVRLILSDGYVDMTLRNIENGEPLAIYASGGEVESFLGITTNNIRVSFLAFVGGLLLALGTGAVLFSNGIMVGSFFAFLFQQGVGREALLVVMIHGTLELSAIAIAGMAGFVLGHSILFPKTYTRAESLKKGALDGIKIVVGLVPVFVTAGFLEGFVTRHTDMPAILSLAIIGTSLAFILFYFVLHPLRVLSANPEQGETHG